MIAVMLIVFLVVTGLVKYFLHMRHFESYVKHVKMGNRSFPFVGNAWSLIGKSTASLFKEITEVTKLNGTPLKGYMGPALVMSLDRPEDIKAVLMSPNCLDKPYLYQFYPRPCGILNARCKEPIGFFSFARKIWSEKVLFGKKRIWKQNLKKI